MKQTSQSNNNPKNPDTRVKIISIINEIVNEKKVIGLKLALNKKENKKDNH